MRISFFVLSPVSVTQSSKMQSIYVNFTVLTEQELTSLHLHLQCCNKPWEGILLNHRGRVKFSELYSADLEIEL